MHKQQLQSKEKQWQAGRKALETLGKQQHEAEQELQAVLDELQTLQSLQCVDSPALLLFSLMCWKGQPVPAPTKHAVCKLCQKRSNHKSTRAHTSTSELCFDSLFRIECCTQE
jgi:hypothetical protein